MSAIKDIQSVLRRRKEMGLPDVVSIAIDYDHFRILFDEMSEGYNIHVPESVFIEQKLMHINNKMHRLHLPQIALLQ